ncbi:GvpL/GvpF family gas vesicle protein [Microtetraspora glauca]|uniref:GvpL/GvpF family gas vesicle protein n=1 Tax=Microtetraspora glauca TaxID=1996 RepID=A0ABV3GNA5_MICGL
MSTSTQASQGTTPGPAEGLAQGESCYVYGVVPADVVVNPEATGVGDPPRRIRLVRHGPVAALVSDVDLERPLGTSADLLAHEALLDATAAEVPVLPFRFGAVMASSEAVVEELLSPYEEEFLAALRELEGRAEYVVKGRYVEQAVLTEILDANPEARRLREEIRGRPEDATRDARIRLGEIVSQAIAAKRDADTQALAERLSPLAAAAFVREPSHERDAVHLALLMETGRQAELRQALDEVGGDWAGQVELRLLGPLAPYDFVVPKERGG